MISLQWLLIARGASIDRETGALTIFAISDSLTANSFPTVMQYVSLVAFLKRKEGDREKAEARLRMIHNGKALFEAPVSIDFQGKLGSHLVLGLNGLVFPSPGQADFLLMLGSRTLGKYTITVAGPHATIGAERGLDASAAAAQRTTPALQTPTKKRRSKTTKRRA